MHAPGIAERAAKACLEINGLDAADLGISAGQQVEINFGAFAEKLPAELNASLLRGVAALPAGLPGFAGLDLPAWGRIKVAL